jgi:hypothetical protein
MIVYPGRVIESDTILIPSPRRRVIRKNVAYEDSDVHKVPGGLFLHSRLYRRQNEGDRSDRE